MVFKKQIIQTMNDMIRKYVCENEFIYISQRESNAEVASFGLKNSTFF